MSLAPGMTDTILDELNEPDEAVRILPIEAGSFRTCEVCRFPVSQSRRVCLDCEVASPDPSLGAISDLPVELTNSGWVRSHIYWIFTALVVAATVAVVVWRF